MKIIFACLLLYLVAFSAQAALVVTAQDIEIRFPDAAAPDNTWIAIAPKIINYWGATETPGVHNPKAKLGDQIWRAWLQDGEHSLGGVEFVISIISLPNEAASGAPARRMELRFRARDVIDGIMKSIGPFSQSNYVDIIGKPGQPIQTGE